MAPGRGNRAARACALGILAWVGASVLALGLGATSGASREIIIELRLPRVILATSVGMGLSVSGAILQVLFSNPLCEPYILGVSSLASLGAVAGGLFGFPLVLSGLSLPAFAGALACAAALHLLALRRESGGFTLLLAGVMLGLFGNSLVAVAFALGDPNGIQGALFWLLGDLSRARLGAALASLAVTGALCAWAWSRWRGLDALLMGEETATSLGVAVPRARREMITLCALVVAVCVSGAGMIGFVGLVAPHFCRRSVGSLHRSLLPLCAIWGATALVAADCVARVAARPYELPVGVVTALAGAPLFLWILLKRGGRA